MTSKKATKCSHRTAHNTVFPNRRQRIVAARRVKATLRAKHSEDRRQSHLIAPNQQTRDPLKWRPPKQNPPTNPLNTGLKIWFRRHHRRSARCKALRIPGTISEASSWSVPFARRPAPSFAITTTSARNSGRRRKTSFKRRRTRFRTTAFPVRREIAVPKRPSVRVRSLASDLDSATTTKFRVCTRTPNR